ncbi:RodZ domain-containing protein [Gallaecimonas sp. GXIMD1310]|uniref:RodZ domain-containing protein n=1 Tax=Gallaecimonas sp. GXIMD1310 TaxID=3131926 RepID=UPI0032553F9A
MTDPLDEQGLLSAGQQLRQAREARGWSVEEVAKRLNLRITVVEKLERDDYDQYSPATYTKGYLRAYSRLLDLREDDVLKSLNTQALGVTQESAAMHSFSKGTSRKKSDTLLTLVTWIIGLVLVALLAYFVWQKTTGDSPIVNDSPSPVTQHSVVEATMEQGTTASETPPPAKDNTTQTAPEPVLAQQSNSGPDKAAAEAPAATTDSLQVAFTGNCWVSITDANGQRLMVGLKTPGQSATLSGTAPFSVKLGAPEHVQLHYHGKTIDLSGFRTGQVAHLTIPQQ